MPKSNKKKMSQRGRPEMPLEARQQMALRISNTAKILFQSEGYGKVSMRKIAREIGCTPMTLYRYYPAKIDVLKSLWGGVFETLFTGLREVKFSPDPQVYLKSLCVAYAEYWLENPEEYRLVFMAEGVTQPDVSLFLGHPNIPAYYGIFLDVIINMNSQGSGHDSSRDTKNQLDFLVSALHGIVHNKITISGYPWSATELQIDYAVKAIS